MKVRNKNNGKVYEAEKNVTGKELINEHFGHNYIIELDKWVLKGVDGSDIYILSEDDLNSRFERVANVLLD